MESDTQFKDFDLLTSNVPSFPFSYMPDIAWRARALLKPYSAEQISWVAGWINSAIDEYFETVKKEEIERLRQELIHLEKYRDEEWDKEEDEEAEYQKVRKFFLWEGDEHGEWVFNTDLDDELDIPTAGSISEVDVLKECEDFLSELDENELPIRKPFEHFAVLALGLLSSTLSWLNQIDGPSDKSFDSIEDYLTSFGIERKPVKFSVSMAGEHAIKAMEAVCHAEHLREVEELKQIHFFELTKNQNDYQNELARLQEAERRRNAEKVARLNELKKKKRDDAKDKVIKEWLKDTSRFPSADQAGSYFSDWLANINITFVPRTVANWIREEAKKRNIRFR